MSSTDIAEQDGETTGVLVEVQLPPELAVSLKRYIASAPEPRPTRAEAIRLMMTDWLSAHGHLEEGDGLTPADLNSSNDG